jgi:endonuclease/exonuclease/phosphatase family metal-dependent hydrolase
MIIATWNLERVSSSEARARRLQAFMRSVRADVWILTETDERLAPAEEMSSLSSDTPERPHREGERWVTIWVHNCHVERVTTADPIRSACARVLRQGQPPLLVYGTVLPWRADQRFAPLRGGDAFLYALRRQSEDWALLRRTYPGHALCVAGDFNQELAGPFRVGTSKGVGALSEALADNDLVCLSGGARDPLSHQTAGLRRTIDHICLGTEMAATTTGVHCWPDALNGLTDHFGTSVEVPDR